MKHRNAFTLIEMLLVVSIIVLLVSLLLAGLSKARAATNVTVCLTTISQLHGAHLQYTLDNQMRNFKYVNSGIYMTHLEKYHSFNDAFRFCPDAPYVPGLGGSDKTAWSYGTSAGTKRGSYGINGFMYHPINSPTGPGEGGNGYFSSGEYHGDNHPKIWYGKLSDGNPSKAPLYADCTWVDGWPMEFDHLPPNYNGSYGAGADYRQMARFAIDRHNMKINLVMGDGSGLTKHVDDLWELEWHKFWDPSKTTH